MVSDVQQIRVKRGRVNHETYRQLYASLHDRIKRRAAANGTNLTYQVPPFVIGRPVYTPSHAVRYVSDKLRRGGFGVTVLADGMTLFIDWTPRPATLTAAPEQQKKRRRAEEAGAVAVVPAINRHTIAARLDALKRKLV